MKKLVLAFVLVLGASAAAFAVQYPELNPLPRHFPTRDRFVHENAGSGGSGNLTNHGGPTITKATIVAIYWGPNWSSGSDASVASTLNSYINNFGGTGEYNTITQYSGIQLTSLGGGSWVDTSAPPTNVTDAAIQAEVAKYISAHGFNSNAIYEVFLPSTSYSSNGSSDSCGGPNLSYCAYHSHYVSGANSVRYASMPYPSCGGCQSAGFTTAQNFEHFISHETREAVTDAEGSAWFDRRGYEADDKCAWSPAPFIDSGTGFAYQYEWSNANSGCIKTR